MMEGIIILGLRGFYLGFGGKKNHLKIFFNISFKQTLTNIHKKKSITHNIYNSVSTLNILYYASTHVYDVKHLEGWWVAYAAESICYCLLIYMRFKRIKHD